MPRALFVALACTLPLALFAIHRDLGHAGDLSFFHEWYLAFRASDAFYRDGPGLNYPIVGVLIVCGPARIAEVVLGPLPLRTFVLVHKATLVLGEVALVLSAAWLARVLGSPRPRALALALYLLPSTWAGGAWFGQTDVLGTALLLASAAALVRYRRGGERRWIAVGALALVLALLAKQLTWFAAPGLALLALAGLRAHRDRVAWAIALASTLPMFAADPFLTLPDGHRSHLWLVLSQGSSHGELAVASGASVWSLFAPGGTPASDLRALGVSSFAWGWLLFAVAMAIAIARLREDASDRAMVALAGIGQLAMATLLTGVHERYLAHAVPLLFLAGEWHTPRSALGVGVAVLGGAFVLSTLHPHAFSGPLAIFARPEPLALSSLAWLGAWLARPRRERSRSPAGPVSLGGSSRAPRPSAERCPPATGSRRRSSTAEGARGTPS